VKGFGSSYRKYLHLSVFCEYFIGFLLAGTTLPAFWLFLFCRNLDIFGSGYQPLLGYAEALLELGAVIQPLTSIFPVAKSLTTAKHLHPVICVED